MGLQETCSSVIDSLIIRVVSLFMSFKKAGINHQNNYYLNSFWMLAIKKNLIISLLAILISISPNTICSCLSSLLISKILIVVSERDTAN